MLFPHNHPGTSAIILLALLFAVQTHTSARGNLAADLVTLTNRLTEAAAGESAPRNAARLAQALSAEGAWPDIDYSDKERTAWAPARHVQQILTLAQAWHFTQDPASLQGALRALDYWCNNTPVCPNWWYNDIGVPLFLYKALLVLGDQVPGQLKQQAVELLKRANPDSPSMTGQNLVWVAEATLGRGCLEQDPELVRRTFERVAQEIRISTQEGIQPDFSFHQHGAQLYSGGYGRGFSLDTPRFAALARGTAFAFSPEKLQLLSDFLRNGQQWMVRGNTFDYSACGREITRPGAGSASPLAEACHHLILAGAPRIDELQTFQARLKQSEATRKLIGHKHFWRSDYTTFHQPEFMASLRMTSNRLLQTELVNSENPIGAFLSDGLTFFYATGDEYRGIFPVWDWRALPGTTEQRLPEPPRVRNGERGENAFAGGVSNGQIGASAMDFTRGSLTARKAWFFFPNTILCLGTGITDTQAVPVATAIEQSLLQGPVDITTPTESTQAAAGQEITVQGPCTIRHGGLEYCFPSTHPILLSTRTQAGSWHRINPSRSKAQVELPVFSLTWDHGNQPTGAQYHYLVRGGDPTTKGRMPTVLSNTPECQAAWCQESKSFAAAFYSPGNCTIPGIGRLTVDHPCLLLIEPSQDGLRIHAAEPTNRPASLSITIQGDTSTHIVLQLPDGPRAGATITATP